MRKPPINYLFGLTACSVFFVTGVSASGQPVIKAVVAHAMGTHLDLFQRIVVSPCSVTAILYTAGGPVVLCVNSTGRDLTTLAPS